MWERMDEGCGETIYVIGQGSGEHSFPFTLFFKTYVEHISHLLPTLLVQCLQNWEDIKGQCDNVNSHLNGHNMLDFKDALSKRCYRCFFSTSGALHLCKGLEWSLPWAAPGARLWPSLHIPSLPIVCRAENFRDPSWCQQEAASPEFPSSARLPCPRPH